MKTERVLEGNLCNLFAILMSLCDSDMKNHVERKLTGHDTANSSSKWKMICSSAKIRF